MLNSAYERLSIKVYSAIQKFADQYRQDSIPRSRLLRLAVLRDPAVRAAGRIGYKVVNADSLQEVHPGDRNQGWVVYFSVYPDNAVIRRHLGAGGMAVFIREGKVLSANGSRSRMITKTTPRGSLDSNQLEDALAAAAGLMVLGVHPETVWRRGEQHCKNPSNFLFSRGFSGF